MHPTEFTLPAAQQFTWSNPKESVEPRSVKFINWKNPFRQALRYVAMSLRDSTIVYSAVKELNNEDESNTYQLNEGNSALLFNFLFAPSINAFKKGWNEGRIDEFFNGLYFLVFTLVFNLPNILIQLPLRLFSSLFEKFERVCEDFLMDESSPILRFFGYLGRGLAFILKQPVHAVANFISDFVNLAGNLLNFFYLIPKTIFAIAETFVRNIFGNSNRNLDNNFAEIQDSLQNLKMLSIKFLINFLVLCGFFAIVSAVFGVPYLLPAIMTAAFVSAKSVAVFSFLAGAYAFLYQVMAKVSNEVIKRCEPDPSNAPPKAEEEKPLDVEYITQKYRATSTHNYYDMLGIKPTCNQTTIKKAIDARSLEWHPDKNMNESQEVKKQNEARFKELDEMKVILKNPKANEFYFSLIKYTVEREEPPIVKNKL